MRPDRSSLSALFRRLLGDPEYMKEVREDDGFAYEEPATHDLTQRRWGHDYYISRTEDGGKVIRVGGWCPGIRKGNYLILQNGQGETTRYRVDEIRYERDPSDMFRAVLTFAPRKEIK